MLPWWAGLRFAFPEVLVWGCLPASVLPIRRAGGPVLPAGASAAEVFAEEPCCRLERTMLCVFPCSSSSLCSPAASAACKLRGVGKSVIFPKEGGGGFQEGPRGTSHESGTFGAVSNISCVFSVKFVDF